MSDDPIAGGGDDDVDEGEGWLATFADISMLLLVFFILLFSLSSVEKTKFLQAMGSIKGALGGDQSSLALKDPTAISGALHEEVKRRKELIEAQKQTFNDIRSFLVQNGVEGQVGAVLDEGTVTLRLPGKVLFGPNSTELTEESKKVLDVLKNIFVQRREQRIDIRGYSDDTPVPADARFADNWELSALRAVTVLRYLLAQGIEADRMTATGYGSLNPILPNTTEENKARNRRVEFVLQRDVTKSQ